MHILIISRTYPNKINKTSGNFVKNQVEALAKHNIKIGVIGVYNVSVLNLLKKFFNLGFYSEKRKNINVWSFLYFVVPKFHFLNNKIKLFIAKILFKKYIKQHGKPDLIHLHTFEPGLIAIWARNKYNIPYMLTEHTSLFYTNEALKWHKKLAKNIYSESLYNIAVSKKSAKDLERRFSCNFNYLPNFVDTFYFKLNKKKKSSNINFINVAFLNKNKNHKLLINAFNKTFGNNDKYQLTIVGKGKEKKNLEKQINKLKLNNVKLHGYATQKELVKLLQKSDIFVLSSNYETFGVVIIEAMSSGLPAVATKCSGVESIITNKKLGLLCEKENLNELSKALANIITHKYDSEYIRNYAIENFSYKVLSKKLINIYSEVIKQNY